MGYYNVLIGTKFGKALLGSFITFYAKKSVFKVDGYFKYILTDIKSLVVRCDKCQLLNSFYHDFASVQCIHCNAQLNEKKIDDCLRYKDFINYKGPVNAKW